MEKDGRQPWWDLTLKKALRSILGLRDRENFGHSNKDQKMWGRDKR